MRVGSSVGTGANRVGSRDDFPAFYRATLPEVYAYALHRCGAAPAAEDVTQEVYVAAMREIARGGEVTIGWLIGVARHKVVDHFRREQRADRLEERAATLGRPVDDEELRRWALEPSRDGVRAALDAMTPTHRLVLLLQYLDGLSVVEIAHAIGRSVHATESLLVRARQSFKRAYAEVIDG